MERPLTVGDHYVVGMAKDRVCLGFLVGLALNVVLEPLIIVGDLTAGLIAGSIVGGGRLQRFVVTALSGLIIDALQIASLAPLMIPLAVLFDSWRIVSLFTLASLIWGLKGFVFSGLGGLLSTKLELLVEERKALRALRSIGG